MRTLVTSVLSTAAIAGCVEPADPPPLSSPEPVAGRARIATPEGTRTVSYKVIDGEAIADGDIILPPTVLDAPVAENARLPAAPAQTANWIGGVVPYTIAPEAVSSAVEHPNRLIDAMRHYQRRTAVRFRPKTSSDLFWVSFEGNTDDFACHSEIGRETFPGSTRIRLANGCDAGAVIHEIEHALGTWHEHSRPDRDNYITVHLDNVNPQSERDQYDKHDIDTSYAFGPYDYGSIMHYGPGQNAFPGTLTITRNDGLPLETQLSALSDGDLRYLNSRYPVSSASLAAPCRTAPRFGRGNARYELADTWLDLGNQGTTSIHESTGTAFLPPVDWAPQNGGWASNHRNMVGDFNLDGRDDLATAWNDGGYNTVAVRLSTGTSLALQPAPWKLRDGPWLETSQWLPGDFNGDNRVDIAVVWNDNNATTVSVALALSTGTGFGAWEKWATRQGGWAVPAQWNVGDFDNDGRDDLLTVWKSGTSPELTVRRSTGSVTTGFQVQQWRAPAGTWDDTATWLTGNFNGAGGTDVVRVRNDNGQATFTMYASFGTQFAMPVDWLTRNGGWGPKMIWNAGDFDNDGLSDIAGMWNDAGMTTIAVRRSTGGSFESGTTWGPRVAGWNDGSMWCAGNFK